MSGDTAVVLAGSASATRLVAALSDLAAVDPAFVLVGGLAVMARLAQAHRATEDLDTLVAGVSFTRAVAMLPTGSDTEGVLRVRDVKVDTIEVDTATSWEQIATLDEPIDRLFTGAHLWAMLTATPVRITAAGNSVVVPVAPVPALLATKLHAYSSPRRSAEKRPSDALDVLRLGRVLVQGHDHAAHRLSWPRRSGGPWASGGMIPRPCCGACAARGRVLRRSRVRRSRPSQTSWLPRSPTDRRVAVCREV